MAASATDSMSAALERSTTWMRNGTQCRSDHAGAVGQSGAESSADAQGKWNAPSTTVCSAGVLFSELLQWPHESRRRCPPSPDTLPAQQQPAATDCRPRAQRAERRHSPFCVPLLHQPLPALLHRLPPPRPHALLSLHPRAMDIDSGAMTVASSAAAGAAGVSSAAQSAPAMAGSLAASASAVPRDAVALEALLTSMGLPPGTYQPRVIAQLLEFQQRQ